MVARSHPERMMKSQGVGLSGDQPGSGGTHGDDLGDQYADNSLWLGIAGLAVLSVGILGIAKFLPGVTGAASYGVLALMTLFPTLPIGFSLSSRSGAQRSGHGWAHRAVLGLTLGLVALIPALLMWAYAILHDNQG